MANMNKGKKSKSIKQQPVKLGEKPFSRETKVKGGGGATGGGLVHGR